MRFSFRSIRSFVVKGAATRVMTRLVVHAYSQSPDADHDTNRHVCGHCAHGYERAVHLTDLGARGAASISQFAETTLPWYEVD